MTTLILSALAIDLALTLLAFRLRRSGLAAKSDAADYLRRAEQVYALSQEAREHAGLAWLCAAEITRANLAAKQVPPLMRGNERPA